MKGMQVKGTEHIGRIRHTRSYGYTLVWYCIHLCCCSSTISLQSASQRYYSFICHWGLWAAPSPTPYQSALVPSSSGSVTGKLARRVDWAAIAQISACSFDFNTTPSTSHPNIDFTTTTRPQHDHNHNHISRFVSPSSPSFSSPPRPPHITFGAIACSGLGPFAPTRHNILLHQYLLTTVTHLAASRASH